jgi:hypothetical protein
MPPELHLDGLLLVPVIVAIIEALKALGVPTKYTPWINAVLSVVFYILLIFVTAHPDYLTAATIGINGLMVFLAAAGFYDRAQATLAGRRHD